MKEFKVRGLITLASVLLASVVSSGSKDQEANFTGVIFIKTHKTASSAVAALLRANALLVSNQSVFIPEVGRGGHQWDFSDPRQRVLARYQGSTVTGSAPYGVWASHIIYHPYVRSLVPNPRVILVTCVREPVQRLFSAWNYYRRIGLLKNEPIEKLLHEGAQVHSEFHPNGMVLELAGVGFEELARRNSEDGSQTYENVPSLVEASWQPRANDALISAGAGVVAAISSRRLIALVTERLDEALRLLLWPRTDWKIEDLYQLRNVDPGLNQVSPIFKESMNTSLDSSQIEAIRKASFLDNDIYAAAIRILENTRRVTESDIISKIPKCSTKITTTKVSNAMETCAGFRSEQTKTSSVGDVSLCRCALLDLNDIEWSEFAHQSLPSIESDHSHSLSQDSELEAALAVATTSAIAPAADCTLDGHPILCSVAAESLVLNVNRPQFPLFSSSTGLFRVIPWRSGNDDSMGSGCGVEVTVVSGNSVEVSVLGSEQQNNARSAALVARGDCSFQEKAERLEKAGYAAVFIVDNDGDDASNVPPTPSLGQGSRVTTPVFLLKHDDGKQIALKARNSAVYIDVTLK
jgi:hypothetical protein